MTSSSSLDDDEDAAVTRFTNAFHRNRATLAGFAGCSCRQDLDLVRDAWYLGLAREVVPEAYAPLARHAVTDATVAATADAPEGLATLVTVVRSHPAWRPAVRALLAHAESLGSDLPGMWHTLEQGRLDWLRALRGAESLHRTLVRASRGDDRDDTDAKMVWMYGLASNLVALRPQVADWATAVRMPDGTRPLVGYDATLWDPRHDAWRPLDLGVQAAAERGGSSVEEAWKTTTPASSTTTDDAA